jgi:predicted phosphodiesterase
VFGHSHRAVNSKEKDVLFFNPGTFRGDIFSFWRRSIGILIVERSIRGEIICL